MAMAQLKGMQTELGAGKVPFQGLKQTLGGLLKAEDIAVKAPEAIQHTQTLVNMLSFGWVIKNFGGIWGSKTDSASVGVIETL